MKMLKVSNLVLILLLFFILPASSSNVHVATYIVYMDNSQMPLPFTTPHNCYSSLTGSLKLDIDAFAPSPKLLYTYNHVIHGFSVVLSPHELQKLKTFPGFLAAYEDKVIKLLTTHTMEFLGLNNSTGLWPVSNFGQKVIVGVVDTGVWPESPSFHDHGMTPAPTKWKGMCEAGEEFNSSLCNNKLIGARFFNKGAKAKNPGANNRLINSPRDSFGHGTHTSSTAAGNFVDDIDFFGYAKGKAKGVAPSAWLAVYNVASEDLQVHSCDLMAGIDQAIADGVDVLSLSLGLGDITFHENPLAIATFAAMEKGVFVATAAGNSGPYYGSLSNAIPWTLTVGAGSVDRSFAATLILGNGATIVGWSLFPASVLLENVPLHYNKTSASCDNLENLPMYSYAIVVCQGTKESLSNQMDAVARANVAGAIFIVDGSLLFEDNRFQWPAVVISEKHASVVISYAEKGHEPVASIRFQETTTGTKPAPVVASYSSRGPSTYNPGLLKPDVLAPGTLILAAYPPHKYGASIGYGGNMILSSDYNLLTGTSMACPHAAGVAALLKRARPNWSPAVLASAMVTTANHLDNTGSPIRDNGRHLEVASPLDVGAGLIDPNRALDPGLVYDITPNDYVNFLCSFNYTKPQLLMITRSHRYDCSTPTSDLNYPSFMAVRVNKSTFLRTYQRTVTNVGDGTALYFANIVPPEDCTVKVTPQKLSFHREYETKNYSLAIQCGVLKTVTHGSLVWLEYNGTRSVRSPIVVVSSAYIAGKN